MNVETIVALLTALLLVLAIAAGVYSYRNYKSFTLALLFLILSVTMLVVSNEASNFEIIDRQVKIAILVSGILHMFTKFMFIGSLIGRTMQLIFKE